MSTLVTKNAPSRLTRLSTWGASTAGAKLVRRTRQPTIPAPALSAMSAAKSARLVGSPENA